MPLEANLGVTYLIECAERATVESRRTAIYEAIAEAGGEAAQDYLIGVSRGKTIESKQAALIKLIGRASRS
ncbi:MAG: hypothetical protein J6N20_19115 [Pseudomonas sp.]|nr:hypothetical protein [Pseudomonas sp.]